MKVEISMYGFLINVSEFKIKELGLPADQAVLLLMKEDGRFEQPLIQYKEGLVELEYERVLHRGIFQFRFLSQHVLEFFDSNYKYHIVGGGSKKYVMEIAEGCDLVSFYLE